MAEIDTGDVVLHKPSGEEWIVAFCDDGRVCPLGWPCSLAAVEDCVLLEKATPEARDKQLRELAAMSTSDIRRSYARDRLSGS